MAETDRAERLKVALRENLKRRKAQARGREADKKSPQHSASGPHSPDHPQSGADPGAPPSRNPAEADED